MRILTSFQVIYANLIRWLTVPQSAPDMNRRNFLNVQIDAVGVGLASTAAPFLPVFLTRLNATTFQVSMLTTMPALTGLILAIPLGQFLQTRRSIVPWFSLARLTVLSSYALTGIITFFMPEKLSVIGILGIWALATIPQTVLNITFSVVMNYVAGPAGRYELMTHRWSILGLTNAITAMMAGQFLDALPFPLNYQLVFIALSAGGLISYYFSSKISIPDQARAAEKQAAENQAAADLAALQAEHPDGALAKRRQQQPPIGTRVQQKIGAMKDSLLENLRPVVKEKSFTSFVIKRFVFLSGTALAAPLLPIYYVRVLNAPDSWIAMINIAANITVIIGYFFWMGQTRRRGSLIVLLATTFGASLYPILVGLSSQVYPVVLYAGLFGIFNAGLNLVLFDELMKRVPVEYSAIFIATAQMLQYMSSIAAPLLATWLSGTIGISWALMISGIVSLAGFSLFMLEWFRRPRPEARATAEPGISREAPAK